MSNMFIHKKICDYIYGKGLTVQVVISNICEVGEITPTLLKSKTRKRNIVNLRQMCFYILRKKKGMVFETIGREFGKDHATVLHGVRNIESLLEIKDFEITELFNRVKTKLSNHERNI